MSFLKNIWTDPVASKLIAALLTALCCQLASRINWLKIQKDIVSFVTIRIPLWIFLLSILAVSCVLYFLC
jgi:hypothetical protein